MNSLDDVEPVTLTPPPLDFLADLRRQGVRLWAEAGKLNYSAPPGAMTPELRAELSRRKPELLAALAAQRPTSLHSQPVIPVPRDQPLPLSYQQERLWFLDQLAPGNPAFNMSSPVQLAGPLDHGALERCLSELVRRHESLRTTFEVRDGQPIQVIHPPEPVRLLLEDLSELPAAERDARSQARLDAHASLRFDLARGPLWQAELLRLAPAEHLLLFTLHHTLSDGWSQNVLFADLAALYAAQAAGQPLALPPLPIQYADYAAWQRQAFTAAALNDSLAYWRRQLADAPSASGLLPDFPRPPVQTYAGRSCVADLPTGLVDALQALSQPESATLFMTLLAALKVLLLAHTGQTDLVIGAPVAARARPQIEKVVGMFVNNLALRTDLSGNPTFRELLRRVRATALAAYNHQHVPFEKLLEDLRPERTAGRTPVFQVFVNMLSQERPLPLLPGLVSTRMPSATSPALFDLMFTLRRTAAQWTLAMTYNTDLFAAERLEGVFQQYLGLLQQIAANPDQPLSAYTVLTAAQRDWLVSGFNATAAPLPPAATVAALIAEQARRQPAHPAVVAGDEMLTYGALDAQANRWARYLLSLGVSRETLVALCLDRSPAMLVALLAIHKAGAAYLPLDPDYPAERLAFMLADSGARLLLTSSARQAALPAGAARVVCVDRVQAEVAALPASPPAVDARDDDLAYMIYTSGSTGQPKGVLVEQRSLLNHVLMAGEAYALGPADRVLQFAALSWDTSVEEIFPALAHGATLVLRSPAMLASAAAFVEHCQAQRVTVLVLATALWHELVASVDASGWARLAETVRLVNFGGERALPDRVSAWQRLAPAHVRLVNTYGASEATAVSTLAELNGFDAGAGEVPVGRPVANVQAYVLDDHQRLVPPGAPGELYLGGLGVARGYHNQPALTASRFLPNPFDPTPGARLYRTGDVARLRADGQLEVRGRADRQVKVRGYRLEPGEIEAALRAHPDLKDAAVVALNDGDTNTLLAYVVARDAESELSQAALRAWVLARLPAYMVPAAFVTLPALPLSPNGKLDLAALPRAPQAVPGESIGQPPRDVVEQQVAALWQEVLQLPAVGLHDDFFALGGHSLLAIRLFSRVESAFGRRLPLSLLFDSPTVAHMADLLRQPAPVADWPVLVPIQPKGTRPPFFCVHDVGGSIVKFAELGRLMGSDQPFYALEAQGFDGKTAPHATITEMAAHYLAAMRQVQPRGPYYVGGYCYGAVVAYEMARQLRAQGDAADLVAVIEGYAPTRHLPAPRWWTPGRLKLYAQNLPGWINDHLELGPAYAWGRFRQVSVQLSKQLLKRLRLHPPLRAVDTIPTARQMPTHHLRVLEALLRAAARYRAEPFEGRVTLFNTQRQSMLRDPDPLRGWQRLARGGVAIRRIRGSHHSILDPGNVESLATALRDELERLQEQGRM